MLRGKKSGTATGTWKIWELELSSHKLAKNGVRVRENLKIQDHPNDHGYTIIQGSSLDIWRRKKTTTRISSVDLSRIYIEIDCLDDGNVPIAPELSDDLQVKISWGLLTP